MSYLVWDSTGPNAALFNLARRNERENRPQRNTVARVELFDTANNQITSQEWETPGSVPASCVAVDCLRACGEFVNFPGAAWAECTVTVTTGQGKKVVHRQRAFVAHEKK